MIYYSTVLYNIALTNTIRATGIVIIIAFFSRIDPNPGTTVPIAVRVFFSIIWTHLLTFASTFHNRDQYQDISNGSDDAADEHEDISLLE
jgi:hypothetical protein